MQTLIVKGFLCQECTKRDWETRAPQCWNVKS